MLVPGRHCSPAAEWEEGRPPWSTDCGGVGGGFAGHGGDFVLAVKIKIKIKARTPGITYGVPATLSSTASGPLPACSLNLVTG